jgi:hypothetical protein
VDKQKGLVRGSTLPAAATMIWWFREKMVDATQPVDHYLALTNGLLAAMIALPDLSQKTQAEWAEASDAVWRSLSDDEKAMLDPGAIEEAKERWKRYQARSKNDSQPE